jgi:hypothetical protein
MRFFWPELRGCVAIRLLSGRENGLEDGYSAFLRCIISRTVGRKIKMGSLMVVLFKEGFLFSCLVVKGGLFASIESFFFAIHFGDFAGGVGGAVKGERREDG